jgi:hypothetical protein
MDGHTQEPLSERGHDHANRHPGLFSENKFFQNVIKNITKVIFMEGLGTIFARVADPDLAFAQTYIWIRIRASNSLVLEKCKTSLILVSFLPNKSFFSGKKSNRMSKRTSLNMCYI